jgi:hypothetical protein
MKVEDDERNNNGSISSCINRKTTRSKKLMMFAHPKAKSGAYVQQNLGKQEKTNNNKHIREMDDTRHLLFTRENKAHTPLLHHYMSRYLTVSACFCLARSLACFLNSAISNRESIAGTQPQPHRDS